MTVRAASTPATCLHGWLRRRRRWDSPGALPTSVTNLLHLPTPCCAPPGPTGLCNQSAPSPSQRSTTDVATWRSGMLQ